MTPVLARLTGVIKPTLRAILRSAELIRKPITGILKKPGPFALRVLKGFKANQGLLLAGAVAYYTLLSLIPLLILLLIVLSHVIAQERLLSTLGEYLEFVAPGAGAPIVDNLRVVLANRVVIGGVVTITMLISSSLAFSVLENSMSVIFFTACGFSGDGSSSPRCSRTRSSSRSASAC